MAQDRDAISLAQIQAGGLPLNATERLSEQASRIGTDREFFTSDLTVNELMLTHECGYEPLGQVMGSCVYNVGWQYQNYGWFGYQNQEFAVISQAHSEARRLAFSRLKQEASLLGADGVVGVQLTKTKTATSDAMIEFIAIGTAVRLTGAPRSHSEPFVSNLSGQDHWMLRKGGFKPIGFVYGNCTWCQYPDYQPGTIFGFGKNMEFTQMTQGIYTARAYASERLNAEVIRLGAQGVVGVTVDFDVEPQHPDKQPMFYLVSFCFYGTAIVPDALAPQNEKFEIPFFMPLSDS